LADLLLLLLLLLLQHQSRQSLSYVIDVEYKAKMGVHQNSNEYAIFASQNILTEFKKVSGMNILAIDFILTIYYLTFSPQ
jgi:hypothetical protein